MCISEPQQPVGHYYYYYYDYDNDCDYYDYDHYFQFLFNRSFTVDHARLNWVSQRRTFGDFRCPF